MCLGKNFAVNEIKVRVSHSTRSLVTFIILSWLQVVLSVLVRYFSFELPHGATTKIDTHLSLSVRPKVAGEEGPKVPLVVRRVEN